MASTYSPSLRLELMATGDQSGTWGDTTNTNLGTLLEQSITGYLSKAMADANQTLTSLDGASDEARNAVVEATGALTAGRNIVVPTAEKLYLIKNSTTGGFAVTVKTTAGTGVAVPMNGSRWVYCDGTNVVDGMSGPLTPTTNSSAALGSSTLGWSALFIESSSAGTLATFTSTDAGATAGPTLDLYRNSATPAASDILGKLLFNGEDSAGNTQEYASIETVILDPTSTSEDGRLDLYATVAGTRTRVASVGPNLDLAAVGQIKFPATQNASADANTLDDYEEGPWTPVATFTTPGNLVVAYAVQNGSYEKIGRQVRVSGQITTTTFTHTTASGSFKITGLPFPSANAAPDSWQGAINFSNIATARLVVAEVQSNSSEVVLIGSANGIALATLDVTNFPTATNYVIRFNIVYRADS